jgi:quercetin dioxygenase-like cupin family protein
MSMRKMNLKAILAGALVVGGLGMTATSLWSATPSSGFTATPIVGPVVMGDVDTKTLSDGFDIKLKSKGESDVYVTHLSIVPGGHGGWHSHPGPSIVTIKAGVATFYDDCVDFVPQVYSAGTGFVEDSGCVHLLKNEGDVILEVVVIQIVPKGAPRRIDEAAPF